MNYGKKGVRAKQRALNSKASKWGRKIIFTLFKVVIIAVVGVGASKLYSMWNGLPYRLVTDSPYFYLSLTAMIIGTLLFLAGFIGELIARNSQERNRYNIEKEI